MKCNLKKASQMKGGAGGQACRAPKQSQDESFAASGMNDTCYFFLAGSMSMQQCKSS